MTTKNTDVLKVDGIPLVSANFNWSVGILMEKFIKALEKKKILAAKCPKCGYITAPPRNRCPKCSAKMEEGDLIELSGKGKLESYTVAHVALDGKGNFVDLKSPRLIGAIKLEGADSTVFMPLEDINAKDLKEGLAVVAQWSDKPKGAISDLKCFKSA